MALGFFKKKKEEIIGEELPPEPMPLPELQPPQIPEIRNLTGTPFPPAKPSAERLAEVEALGLKPAAPSAPSALPSEMPPAPRFRPVISAMPVAKSTTEELQEIAEAIIAERWQKVSKEIDELKRVQEDLSAAIGGMQERMSNLEKKMDMVIQEVLGKVEEYGKGISDVSTELKAMQKVFNTILPTFTEDIKELHELVGEAKEKGIKAKKK